MSARGYNFDALLNLRTAGAVTASQASTVSGNPQTVDVGSARLDGTVVFNISAVKTTAGNETYTVALQGSTDPTFATGVESLFVMPITAAGRIEAPFTNEKYFDGRAPYRYLRLYETLGGTSPSLNFAAFLSTPELG